MIITIDKNRYTLSDSDFIDSGKEATVYDLKNDSIVKILDEDFKSDNKIKKILALCDKSDYLSSIKGFENIAIPVYPAYDSDTICGYSMAFFKDCKTINELAFDILESTYSYDYITDTDLFKIIEKLFVTLQILHHQKIILGDINSNNILWNPKTNDVYIIDLDSAKVGEFYATMSTPDYLCPVVKRMGEDQNGGLSFSTSSDIYALTIICFEMLTGIHPCDIGVQPVLDKSEKMEKGITYLSYHFQKKTTYQGHKLFNKDSFAIISKRLDLIQKKSPRVYQHFINVFHFGKRHYLQRKNIAHKALKKRTRKIQAIRSISKNKKQYDPKELHIFLETYNLKTPNYVK